MLREGCAARGDEVSRKRRRSGAANFLSGILYIYYRRDNGERITGEKKTGSL